MASDLVIWAIFFSFFFLAFGFMLLEAFFISKKGWTSFARGFLCSFLSYVISFIVCFCVCFVVFGVILAVSFDGTISKTPNGEIIAIVALVLTAIFVPTFTTLVKWLMLKLMKIQKGLPAFGFSAVSSIIAVIVSVGFPSLVMYLVSGMKF
jgi:hypothetical protein